MLVEEKHPSSPAERVIAALLADPIDEETLLELIPELTALQGCQQPPHHAQDVYTHTLLVVQGVARIPLLRVAALLHDIGKPLVQTWEGDSAHFYGHEAAGATLANQILWRLEFGEQFRKNAVQMVFLHMRFNKYTPIWGSKAVHRLRRDAGMFLFQLCILLAIADCSSDKAETRDEAETRLMDLYNRGYSIPSGNNTETRHRNNELSSPLSGTMIRHLVPGKEPGAWISATKRYLSKEVKAGRVDITDIQRAKDLARDYLRRNFSDDATRARD